jgi:hypothetical protein
VRRAVAGLGALFISGALAGHALAATTYEGAAKFGYTVNPSLTAHIATNYAPNQTSFITGTGTILTSGGGGSCTSPASDAINSYTLTFGSVTPPTIAGAAVGCLYQNAIGMSINSNDSNGYTIYETLDVTGGTPPADYGVCVYHDVANNVPSTTTMPSGQASPPDAADFNFPALTIAGCLGYGIQLGNASGTVTNAGNGGDVGGAGASATVTPTSNSIYAVPAGTVYTGTVFFGEDVQLNVPIGAPGVTGATHAIIVYFVPG